MRLSLKLGALCAGAAIVPLAAASIILLLGPNAETPAPVFEQAEAGARSALSIYEKRLEQMRLASQHLANEIGLKILAQGSESEPLSGAKLARLQDLLSRARDELSLDFLIVTERTGRVIARHNDLPGASETLASPSGGNRLATRVITEGAQLRVSPLADVAVERGEQLSRLWLDKAARVSRPDGTALEDALVIEAAAPIFSSGRFSGAILIGQMLNNYYLARAGANQLQVPLVAEVKQTCFGGNDPERGAVIALGDTIIASSLEDATTTKPALLGSRRTPSQPGETLEWNSQRYEIAWKQMKTLDGNSIGAVGVAARIEEPPLAALSTFRLAAFLAGAGVLLALIAGLVAGRALAARVNSLSDAVTRMSVGELSTTVRDRIGLNGSNNQHRRDEIGRLAEQLEHMRESFRQAIERMRKR
jgi:HAMP domain-containing protein